MRNFQLQTPQRDQNSANRRQKTTPDLSKNQPKVTKKSLNPAFKAVSDEDSTVFQTLKELTEASGENLFGESAENLDTYSSETVAISDLTSQSPLSSSTTIYEANTKTLEVDSSNKIESVEAEVVIKHLKEARVHVLKSNDVGPSKKLLEALINVIIEELHGRLYEENEWLDKLLSRQSNLVILIFGMGIFTILMLWFFNSSSLGSDTTPIGPTPT